MIQYEKIVSDVLREYADRLDSGTCNLSKDEALQIVSNIAHVSMNKQEVADRYNVSQKTIERKEKEDLIPPSHPIIQSKKQWYLDELIKFENQ